MTTKLGDFFTDQTRKRRLLALDGGGVRGMFTIGVLQELEAQLRDRYKDRDYKLCQYFDLIAGTSTGSIIATGLALGMTTAEISAYYKELCPKIFKSPAPSVWAALMYAKLEVHGRPAVAYRAAMQPVSCARPVDHNSPIALLQRVHTDIAATRAPTCVGRESWIRRVCRSPYAARDRPRRNSGRRG